MIETRDKDAKFYIWKEILGAPDRDSKKMNSEEIKMNKKPKKASAWKGDVLIQALCEKRVTLTPECLAVINQVY